VLTVGNNARRSVAPWPRISSTLNAETRWRGWRTITTDWWWPLSPQPSSGLEIRPSQREQYACDDAQDRDDDLQVAQQRLKLLVGQPFSLCEPL
jgi:hypothetical protein